MTQFNAKLAEIVRKDPRYAYEAYEFIFQALHQAQQRAGTCPDPTGAEERGKEAASPRFRPGIARRRADLALREFGLMARTVLSMWGIHKTDDFGEIVFNLIDAKFMSKTDDDSRAISTISSIWTGPDGRLSHPAR